jgi:hypothetical protein
VAYASKSCNKAERNYSSYQGECLAAVWAVEHFRVYLYGRPFDLITDHKPLTWLLTNQRLTGMVARWANLLQEYTFRLCHRDGESNKNADGLSRNLIASDHNRTDARMDFDPHIQTSVAAGLAVLAGRVTTRSATRLFNSGTVANAPDVDADLGPVVTQAPQLDDVSPWDARVVSEAQVSIVEPDGSHSSPERMRLVLRLWWTHHPLRKAQSPVSGGQAESPASEQALAVVPSVDSEDQSPPIVDVWLDVALLRYLETGAHVSEISQRERDRIWHRARTYRLKDGVLRCVEADGSTRVVPKPDQRVNLIRHAHQDVGHYGVRKTYSLLEPTYWWSGMMNQVKEEVAACTVCDRVKISFEVKDPKLKPLTIMGLFYRWGCDLCKMPVESDRGNRYVMVMIEHFSKWIEMVPLPAKKPKYTAAALRDVLT